MLKRYDVLVVGAGPAGSTVAKEVSARGFKVLMVEEHKEIGKPIHCSGLISKNIFNTIKLKKEEIERKIKGATFYSPSLKKATILSKKTQAYVVDRSKFDKRLAEEAVNNGTELRLNTKVLNYNDAKIIVGADGVNSLTREKFGFPKIKKFISGIAVFYKYTGRENKVSLYFGNEIAPDFFAWHIPRRNEVEYGLATTSNAKAYLSNFLKMLKIENKPIRVMAGVIPMRCIDKTVKGNVLLVGDAAGQVKATTGGGVVINTRIAKIAADVIIKALENENIGYLKNYESAWRNKLGRELNYSYLIRKFLNSFDDEQYEQLIKLVSMDDVNKFILKCGDMDYPSALFKGFIKEPRMFKYAVKFAPHLPKFLSREL